MARRRFNAVLLTICTSCDTEVGCWATPFNRTLQDQVIKTSRHHAGGRPCPGSLLAVHPNATWANEPEKDAS
jgi:hypothetical protein